MLESHHLFVLVLAHLAIATTVVVGFTAREWAVAVTAFVAMVLFAWAAIASTNITIITDSGSVVTRQQPAIGWYAYGMAFISLILGIVAVLTWLPTGKEALQNATG
jgi:hypothetical protein